MILTEEAAKTKWCPEVRTGLNAGVAVNRHIADAPNDGVYDETRCIGSACMAWRWHGDKFSVVGEKLVLTGYCGKAGRP